MTDTATAEVHLPQMPEWVRTQLTRLPPKMAVHEIERMCAFGMVAISIDDRLYLVPRGTFELMAKELLTRPPSTNAELLEQALYGPREG